MKAKLCRTNRKNIARQATQPRRASDWIRLALTVLSAVVQSACGGGGGDGSSTSPTAPAPIAPRDTVSQAISAASGGTITLSNGSSLSIPAGALAADQTITLSLVSTLPHPLPNGAVTGVGSGLAISFSKDPGSSASGSLQLVLKEGAGGPPPRIVGSAAVADYVDLSGGDQFVGIQGSYNSSSNSASISVPLPGPSGLSSVVVSQANVRPAIELAPMPSAGGRIWNGTGWETNLTPRFDPALKTLVLIHGMRSSVEDAWGDKNCVELIKRNGGYQQVIGFDYNWTQGIETSGQQLAAFMESLRTAGITQIDAEAHSEGVPVLLSASTKTQLAIGNLVALGGPIMGTPAAAVGSAVQALSSLSTVMLNWNFAHSTDALGHLPIPGAGGLGDIQLQDLLKGPFANDLLPGSPVLLTIRNAVIARMAQAGSNLSRTHIIAAAGSDYTSDPSMSALGTVLRSFHVFPDGKFDGIIAPSSALAIASGFDDSRIKRLPTYSLSHTQLECDFTVCQDVGLALVQATPAPTIGSFTASLTTITVGQSSTLAWSGITNGVTCSIDNGVGSVSCSNASASVSPGSTTTYTLTATGPGGSAAKSVTVTVAPAIGSFTASPTTILAGQSSTLAWSGITNGVTCSIDNGVGSISCSNGSASVSPGSTTTYTLTAIRADGSPASATAIVTVLTANTSYNGTYNGQFNEEWEYIVYDKNDVGTTVKGSDGFSLIVTLRNESPPVNGYVALTMTHVTTSSAFFGCQAAGCDSAQMSFPFAILPYPASQSCIACGFQFIFPNKSFLATKTGIGWLQVSPDGSIISNGLDPSIQPNTWFSSSGVAYPLDFTEFSWPDAFKAIIAGCFGEGGPLEGSCPTTQAAETLFSFKVTHSTWSFTKSGL